MKIRQSELEAIYLMVNHPRKLGPKWCTYNRETVNKMMDTIKGVMGDNGYEFKDE